MFSHWPPVLLQRFHWKLNLSAAPPLYSPGSATSCAPSAGRPEILGAVLLVGAAAGVMTAEGFEFAVEKPSAFVAVTSTTNVRSRSAFVTVYALSVWPLSLVQLPPFASQRTHW